MDKERINQITGLLLLIGFGSAFLIYLNVDPTPANSLLDDPRATKKYLHELQVIGGQANMLAAEFQDWFAGLWQGVALARTVAVLTVGVTLVFRFVAKHPGTATPMDGKAPPSGSV